MTHLFERYRAACIQPTTHPVDDSLLIERSGALACHYAPFDHINRHARVVLVGITPGAQQAGNALAAVRRALEAGMDHATALAEAKAFASFSGSMRASLVAMLDHVGLHHRLGIEGCADLFSSRTDLVHFTSALRYPVFHGGDDYSGNPSIMGTPFLKALTERWLREEMESLPMAYWLPLGKEPTAVMEHFIAQGVLDEGQVLAGLPHPSGANAERIAYFLGRKPREALSPKTNADALDRAREGLQMKLGEAPVASTSRPPLATAHARATTSPATPKATPKAKLSAKVAQAEAEIASRLSRIRDGNDKIAGFETPRARHLALQRTGQSIRIWTEDLDSPTIRFDYESYSPTRSRHSNLTAQAPRVAHGRAARCWRLDSVADVKDLLDWYEKA